MQLAAQSSRFATLGGSFDDILKNASKKTAKIATSVRESRQRTFRELLSESEQVKFQALKEKYPEWMPSEGLDTAANVRNVAENAQARAQFRGRGHHPHPLKFGGEPNPTDLVSTGETRIVKNPIHTEITNFWNEVLRRLTSQNRN
jgi:hypothetical protein